MQHVPYGQKIRNACYGPRLAGHDPGQGAGVGWPGR